MKVYLSRTFLSAFALPFLLFATAQAATAQTFTLADRGNAADICVATDDYEGVKIAAQNLHNDIRLAYDGQITTSNGRRVIIGTIGHSALIDSLVRNQKIDVRDIKDGWERFIIEGCGDNLVIAGSDRRGTIYGIYELSRRIGVTPWTWWADVPVKQQKLLTIDAKRFVKASPSIRYRGIFINDEDWGLKPWASLNYEKELDDIGPKTYERVCELILRLGGNMLAPAMHTCTGAFYSHPESKVVADRLGVIITTSHCEPMLFNNASLDEWDGKRDGAWDYRTNRNTILGKFANRVAEACTYDNIYTTAMRGVHDEGMHGARTPQERVAVLTEVIKDQRNLLELFTKKPANEVPQIFVPYKEALDVYLAGLQVPDDITLIWVDDNYGYMKRLSTPEEQKRSGRSGVYYHLSYLGAPHDYLWLNTTAPVLMYEELIKAYRTGADRYWLLNVGDIKPMELGMQTFFELADNVEAFDFEKINSHQATYLASIFGEKYRKDFQFMLGEYYRLAWSRKPEYMGWDRMWDRKDKELLHDTEFSFQHYNDAQRRLADYQRIATKAKSIMQQLPEVQRPAFYELMAFQIMAAEQMNRKFLMAQLNHEKHAAGLEAEANWAADRSQEAYDSIEALQHTYNTLLDGKWNEMMRISTAYMSKQHLLPQLFRTAGVQAKAVDLRIDKKKDRLEGCTLVDLTKANKGIVRGVGYDWHVLQLMQGDTHDFTLGKIEADSVTLHIYALPFFPVYAGKGNAYGISLDGGKMVKVENKFVEYGESWKDQVMQNGKHSVVTLPIDRSKSRHTLRLHGVDDGQMIERLIVDWGGLKPTYVGPTL